MTLTENIAKHLQEVYTGGNWTASDLEHCLSGIIWQQATTQVGSLNTIATLVYHIGYYLAAVIPVLEGGALNASDKLSFDAPAITCAQDWDSLVDSTLANATRLAGLVALLPEHKMWESFTDEKYGTYYRNLHGIIEHTHYHLGQIALIKKQVQQEAL